MSDTAKLLWLMGMMGLTPGMVLVIVLTGVAITGGTINL